MHTLSSLPSLVALLRQGVLPTQGVQLASKELSRLLHCQAVPLLARHEETNIVQLEPLPEQETAQDSAEETLPEDFLPLLRKACQPPLEAEAYPEQQKITLSNNQLLITRAPLRKGSELVLVLWKATPWEKEESALVSQFWQIAASLFALEDVYRRMHCLSDHDAATSLFNWTGLKEEISRRLVRSDANHQPGTLMRVQVNGMERLTPETHPLADLARTEEQWLVVALAALRKAVRPTDPIGRIGGNQFVLWLDGGDRFAAAERAATLTAQGILQPEGTSASLQIGLACREAGSQETLEQLLEQATLALHQTRPLSTADTSRQNLKAPNDAWRFSHLSP